MIIKMHKYTFLVFHKDYEDFLESLQQVGVLHIVEREETVSDEFKQKYIQINQFEKTIRFLIRRGTKQQKEILDADGTKIMYEIIAKQKELETLKLKLYETKKQFQKAKFWGDFSVDIIKKLKDKNLYLKFYIASKNKFNTNLLSEFNAEIITEHGNYIYFITIQQGDKELNIDAEEIKQPENSLSEIESRTNVLENSILLINTELDNFAKASIPLLTKAKEALSANLEYEKAKLNTDAQAEEKIMLLEGWVPNTKKERIEDFLNESNILHIIGKASKKDKIPVLMQNNRFSKLFEPIGKLFSLPAYSELDLTMFFAPFFMLFFGFCLGDAGYGLLFVIGAGIYKLKAKKEIKPLLSLLQLLGLATILFGIITGTFFGINLIETDIKILENYRKLFLNPDNMFNLALILGAAQIVFGMCIKAANQIKQYGFTHSLATFGWLLIIIGFGVYMVLTKLEYIAINNLILYAILSIGGFLIVFFSDVEVSIPARIGKGIWDIYSTVTGIFGDILSYIRLFALGLSSAILGFVINDIGMQILGSSKILGPVLFVIFLLLGHTLNILIATLGSFVHPMRLTFVEFYKNAGFRGGGKEYKPFSK
ncbi:MAG: V-type ATP synthase subunit I [Draconibacterium sp.]|nr:V-type ATP synthase subunit I [Draconibacterium sp.]